MSTGHLAAWRWVSAELGDDEPLDVDKVIAVCLREQKRPRDSLHARWADAVMQDLIGVSEA